MEDREQWVVELRVLTPGGQLMEYKTTHSVFYMDRSMMMNSIDRLNSCVLEELEAREMFN